MTDKIQKIKANEKNLKTQICQFFKLSYKFNSKFPGGQNKKESRRNDKIHSVPKAFLYSLAHQLGTNFHVFIPWNKAFSSEPWSQENRNDQI